LSSNFHRLTLSFNCSSSTDMWDLHVRKRSIKAIKKRVQQGRSPTEILLRRKVSQPKFVLDKIRTRVGWECLQASSQASRLLHARKIYTVVLQKLECHVSDFDCSEPLRGPVRTGFDKKPLSRPVCDQVCTKNISSVTDLFALQV
jgi:hypothetical protein